ncbi:AAA family ATPase [Sphingomonas sanxanigenens]|uniref:AAA+ ATPase domain-containing protein n=1 Tax=Sphingomonas sanxanigenens DSM 19645 = NX02 TaxID=1123269 RepID=W0A8H6_9SPHN|nr:AAA family ATPase [Sphingomonas sanxanigenens]AHE52787.1 hypothetical protein NX02_05235 [Sphingomonas sanxanigenens DSM 19645 = NX02]
MALSDRAMGGIGMKMEEMDIVRGLLLRLKTVKGRSPLGTALGEWAGENRAWLGDRGIRIEPKAGRIGWRRLVAALEAAPQGAAGVEPPRPLRIAAALAEALRLGKADARLLQLAVGLDRVSRLSDLARRIAEHHRDMPVLIAEIAGHSEQGLRMSLLLTLGLIRFRLSHRGAAELDLGWTLSRLLDRGITDRSGLIEAMVGLRQTARLGLEDFSGVGADAARLVRLLAGALREGAAGVNILIHGPPGTGKTELARTLAAAAGAALFSVGEADEDGEEPDRWERAHALQLAHRVLTGRGDALLLFDEMEDMIGDASPGPGDWFRDREGSKIWINRLLETNAVPVIWTTNAIGNVEPAILRRMSFVLHLDVPTPAAARRMIARIAADEAVTLPAAFDPLLAAAPEAATVARVAMRVGRLSGDAEDITASARSLVTALRAGRPVAEAEPLADLDLFETDLDVASLLGRFAQPDGPSDFSLLLTGPPGTGKTALGHHLAHAIDRPLIVRRASDLLSKWVGETEAHIAGAFREAERRGGVLLFDEVDSLLYDRGGATRSWEVTQVNELLTWLDRHPLPFVATTNHASRLDPAALRRFVFKLDLRPFGAARAARAFERFFGMAAPAALAELTNLTPGDFAVVRRQIRHLGVTDAEAIVARLGAEAALKPGGGRIGF